MPWLLAAAALLVAAFPISSDELWWQLSRGRAVLAGMLAPSSALLALESRNDADWLGGLPPYLLYTAGGFSALMLAKLGLAVAATVWAWRRFQGGPPLTTAIVIVLTAIALRQTWEPVPATFDVVGVVVLWQLSQAWLKSRSRGAFAAVVAAMIVWSNFAPRPLFGLLTVAGALLAVAERRTFADVRRDAMLLLAATAGCGINPAGPAALIDSLRQMVPLLFVDGALLAGTRWAPPSPSPHPAMLAWWALQAAWIVVWLGDSRPARIRHWYVFVAMQALAWTSRANLEPVAAWTGVTLLAMVRQWPVRTSSAWFSRWAASAAVAATAGFVVSVATGAWRDAPQRLGWGLNPALEWRLFDASLGDAEIRGTAWCSDVRAAGLLTWLRPRGPRPQDVPARALCGERFRQERLLRADLARGWRDRHRRQDGGWGGWWIPLEERETRILLVNAEETDLIAALEPTLWKPLSLDSPVLPFGPAGHPQLSQRIVQVLHERQLVDRGAWAYHGPPASGPDQVFDLWGWILGRADPQMPLRQAEVFRAMQLPIASLRVLRGIGPADRSRAWRQQFARCQLDLAYAERLTAGRSSDFRALAWLVATDADSIETTLHGSLQNADVRQTAPAALQACVTAYTTDDLERAFAKARGESAELQYARALLALEAGQPDEASRILKDLIERFPHERLTAAARDVLASLSS